MYRKVLYVFEVQCYLSTSVSELDIYQNCHWSIKVSLLLNATRSLLWPLALFLHCFFYSLYWFLVTWRRLQMLTYVCGCILWVQYISTSIGWHTSSVFIEISVWVHGTAVPSVGFWLWQTGKAFWSFMCSFNLRIIPFHAKEICDNWCYCWYHVLCKVSKWWLCQFKLHI